MFRTTASWRARSVGPGAFNRASGVRFSRFPSLADDEGESQRQSSDARSTQLSISSFQPSRKESTVGNPSKDLIETEGALRTVIETLIDNQEGFRKIGEALEDETLKRYFLDESLKRAEFRGELENILHQEGVKDIQESGSAAGTFIRLFTGLKTALGAGADALLNTAEEAEARGDSGLRGRAGEIPARPGSGSPGPAGRPR